MLCLRGCDNNNVSAILVWGRVGLQLHPESTLAPLGGTLRWSSERVSGFKILQENRGQYLREPGPLDVGVLLSTNAANHSELEVMHNLHSQSFNITCSCP